MRSDDSLDSDDADEFGGALDCLGDLSEEERQRWRREVYRIIDQFRDMQVLLKDWQEPDWGKLTKQLRKLRGSLIKVADHLDELDDQPAFHAALALYPVSGKTFTTDVSYEDIAKSLDDLSSGFRLASKNLASPNKVGRPEENLDKNQLVRECFIVFEHCRPEIWGWCRPDQRKQYNNEKVKTSYEDFVVFVERIYEAASGTSDYELTNAFRQVQKYFAPEPKEKGDVMNLRKFLTRSH